MHHNVYNMVNHIVSQVVHHIVYHTVSHRVQHHMCSYQQEDQQLAALCIEVMLEAHHTALS